MLYVSLDIIWPNIRRAPNRPVTLSESETTGFWQTFDGTNDCASGIECRTA